MSDIIIAQDRIQRINAMVLDIEKALVGSIEKAIELGKELLSLKETSDHGEFQSLIERNFRFSYKTARKWMTLAENEKEVRKQLRGGALKNLSEAYSVKTAGLALAGPQGPKAPKAPKQQLLGGNGTGGTTAEAEWSGKASGRLKRHKLLSRGGQVFVLPEGSQVPTLIYKGSFYLDPVPGAEWAHRDVLANLDKGLELLFENYFYNLELTQDGEPIPEPRPETNVTPATEAQASTPAALEGPAEPTKPQYRSTLDEED